MKIEGALAGLSLTETQRFHFAAELADVRRQASDKLAQRLGWMTRAHPFVLDGNG